MAKAGIERLDGVCVRKDMVEFGLMEEGATDRLLWRGKTFSEISEPCCREKQTLNFDDDVVVCVYSAAVKQNIATKDSSKKMMEDELAVWFGNARDRGTGIRRLSKHTAVVAEETDVDSADATANDRS